MIHIVQPLGGSRLNICARLSGSLEKGRGGGRSPGIQGSEGGSEGGDSVETAGKKKCLLNYQSLLRSPQQDVEAERDPRDAGRLSEGRKKSPRCA